MTTKDEIRAAIEVLRAVADAIKALGSVPSGHLYAQLAGVMTIGQYEKVIEMLKGGGLIRVDNHLITWVG